MNRNSLRVKLLLIIGLLIFISLAANTLLIVVIYSSALEKSLINNSIRIGSTLNAQIEQSLKWADLKNIPGIEGLLAETKKQDKIIKNIRILDFNGEILFSTNKELLNKTPSDDDSEAMKKESGIRTFHYPGFFDIALPITNTFKTDSATGETITAGYMRIQISDNEISSVSNQILLISFAISVFIIIIVLFVVFYILMRNILIPLTKLSAEANKIARGNLDVGVIETRSQDEIGELFDSLHFIAASLKTVIVKTRQIASSINSSAKEIEGALDGQSSSAHQHVTGIMEVNSAMGILLTTAEQVTRNTGELVLSSSDMLTEVKEGEKSLTSTITELDEIGTMSSDNAMKIRALGKQSEFINEMVVLIKGVSNKTNILSVNASIEASRAGAAGRGFAVIASEIRELSKETIASAKRVEKTAREIRDSLGALVKFSENESVKVLESVKIVKLIYDRMEAIVKRINSNYDSVREIDVLIKHQENGSRKASYTINQLVEIARQSAEISRQTVLTMKDIADYGSELEESIRQFNLGGADILSDK